MITRIIYHPEEFDLFVYLGVLVSYGLENAVRERGWLDEHDEILSMNVDGDKIHCVFLLRDDITFIVENQY